jgi:hypothetical protein
LIFVICNLVPTNKKSFPHFFTLSSLRVLRVASRVLIFFPMRFRFSPVSTPTQKSGLHSRLLALLVLLPGVARADLLEITYNVCKDAQITETRSLDVPRYNVQFLWEPYLAGSQSELGVAEADSFVAKSEYAKGDLGFLYGFKAKATYYLPKYFVFGFEASAPVTNAFTHGLYMVQPSIGLHWTKHSASRVEGWTGTVSGHQVKCDGGFDDITRFTHTLMLQGVYGRVMNSIDYLGGFDVREDRLLRNLAGLRLKYGWEYNHKVYNFAYASEGPRKYSGNSVLSVLFGLEGGYIHNWGVGGGVFSGLAFTHIPLNMSFDVYGNDQGPTLWLTMSTGISFL